MTNVSDTQRLHYHCDIQPLPTRHRKPSPCLKLHTLTTSPTLNTFGMISVWCQISHWLFQSGYAVGFTLS